MPAAGFDLIVVGSGPGGYRAAVLAALRGLKVAVIEKREWGGCCLNRGCVPKKAWYHSARLIAAQGSFAARGVEGGLRGDLARAWQHQRKIVAGVRASYTDYLGRLGVRLVEGEARFTDARTVLVAGERITAGSVIVATGSEPYVPPGLPRRPGRVLTTDDLFAAEPPSGRRIAVLGSGVIGTEFAFILRMLGCEVLWLAGQAPLARSRYSRTARQTLGEALAAFDLAPRPDSRVDSAAVDGEEVLLRLPDGGQERVDWVLYGAGRRPHTSGLDIEAAGVTVGMAGFIEVDERQRTAAQGVYAIGDVANPAMTSNHALADAAVAVGDIIAPGSSRHNDDGVPQVVYSAAELARIGIDEETAEARGLEPATGFAAFDASPAALAEVDGRGYVRIVADVDSGAMLGAEVVGHGAGELVHLLGIEFGSADALRRLATVAYNHPARAEEILNATETLAARWGLARRVFG